MYVTHDLVSLSCATRELINPEYKCKFEIEWGGGVVYKDLLVHAVNLQGLLDFQVVLIP